MCDVKKFSYKKEDERRSGKRNSKKNFVKRHFINLLFLAVLFLTRPTIVLENTCTTKLLNVFMIWTKRINPG